MTLSLLLALTAVAQTVSQPPLRISYSKQLLIDDFIVESRHNLSRVLHQPERHSGNPVIVGDQPWEKWHAAVDGRPVVYDEETQEFKMYYVAALLDASAPTGFRYKAC